MITAPRLFRPYALILLVAVSLIGCATVTPGPALIRAATAHPPENPLPVIRYGRYTLVEINPTHAQTNLLEQVVHLNVPVTANATVGVALDVLLAGSGFRLCEDNEGVQGLRGLPLPSSHFAPGPLTLKSMLEVLAGPAWELQVDALSRTVCFKSKSADAGIQP
jgi:type IV pili sensor histidine kinase/response regulator